jgi:hypothetical protein
MHGCEHPCPVAQLWSKWICPIRNFLRSKRELHCWISRRGCYIEDPIEEFVAPCPC